MTPALCKTDVTFDKKVQRAGVVINIFGQDVECAGVKSRCVSTEAL